MLDIVDFVYRYNTLDIDLIKQDIPEAEGLDIDLVLKEDFEKLNREIEYAEQIHPEYAFEEDYYI